MISPKFFIDALADEGIDFFAGVPDSLLKNICAYIADTKDERHNIIAANEGGAVGLAAGYHLATGKVGCVYMQNSGEGNIINPIASLTDKEVYHIPVLLLIGWRGRPGQHDEPQHVKQGKVTTGLLNVMGINYDVLSKDEEKALIQIRKAVEWMKATGEVYALIVEKDTFDSYTLQSPQGHEYPLSREEAIDEVASRIGERDVIVSTTGMISRELFEYRTAKGESHERDFLTVGSMGHASQIALGIAVERQERRVWCFDGDGASIMHMGNMAIVATKHPKNYVHVVFNNGAHDSVGGQPTVGLDIDLPLVAKALGYKTILTVTEKEELPKAIRQAGQGEGPVFLHICVRKGNRKELGRPTTTPIENKTALMKFLQTQKLTNSKTYKPKNLQTAVIMAAGMGTRFGERTELIPKGFIPVGGVPMVERSIRTLRDCGIRRIVIGTGYHKEHYEALAERIGGIECVFSPRFAETNSMQTLWNCRDVIGTDDFILLESDLVFEKRAITSLMECPKPDVMLITPVTKFQDQYYIEADAGGTLTNCSVRKDEVDAQGELVGIHKLSNVFYRKMCKDYAAIAEAQPKLGYEYELLRMSQRISPVHVLNVPGLLWYEIDDEKDLRFAETLLQTRKQWKESRETSCLTPDQPPRPTP